MKRFAVLLLLAAFLLSAAGCSGLYETTYYVEIEYTDDDSNDSVDLGSNIDSYAALKRAISALVQRHESEGTLRFSNYEGEIDDDLAAACQEVKNNTAVGAFSVDYISYDVNRIVSYYEAEVYIAYKRTAAQVDSIVSALSQTNVRETLDEAFRVRQTYLAVKTSASMLDRAEIEKMLEAAAWRNPESVVARPEVKFEIFPEDGLQKIIEFSFVYPLSGEEMAGMQMELEAECSRFLEAQQEPEAVCTLLRLGQALADETQVLPEGESETAYAALCMKAADSQGIALAYKALCDRAGVTCTVVKGLYQDAYHYWNVVTLDGVSYHVDVSLWQTLGAERVFFADDADLGMSHIWDVEQVPACAGELNYYSVSSMLMYRVGTGE